MFLLQTLGHVSQVMRKPYTHAHDLALASAQKSHSSIPSVGKIRHSAFVGAGKQLAAVVARMSARLETGTRVGRCVGECTQPMLPLRALRAIQY